jgi:hypothetical protein
LYEHNGDPDPSSTYIISALNGGLLGGRGVLREAIIIDEGPDLRTHIPSHPANWSLGNNFYSILKELRTTKT